MPVQYKNSAQRTLHRSVISRTIHLEDGQRTLVHLVRYRRSEVRPRVVVFTKDTLLLDWCRLHDISDAMVGGFFLRKQNELLGDLWVNGQQYPTVPFDKPWHKSRGSLYVSPYGHLELDRRNKLPASPKGDLLQAGPLLARNGQSLMEDGEDSEGVSAASRQFDDDIAVGRFPRAAIGTSDNHIFCLVAEGYSVHSAGLSFRELAAVMLKFGAQDVLNLDGGSSSTLVSGSKLINTPRGGQRDNYRVFPSGRPIHSAIVFEQR